MLGFGNFLFYVAVFCPKMLEDALPVFCFVLDYGFFYHPQWRLQKKNIGEQSVTSLSTTSPTKFLNMMQISLLI